MTKITFSGITLDVNPIDLDSYLAAGYKVVKDEKPKKAWAEEVKIEVESKPPDKPKK